MKKLGSLLLLLLCLPALAADKPFRVALLTTGPVSDGGWNASAYEGLQRIKKELGADVSQMETRTPLEFEEGMREYAKLGYDLVIGHGFEFQDPAMKLGTSFPNTVFVTSAGDKAAGNNVSPVSFALGEGTYLLGIVAGSMTKSGTVGVIGGMELPPVKKAFDAFEAGFKSVRPGGKVLRAYLGSWEDVSGGKEAAKAQIRQGADFIIHNADAAGLGVVQAASETPGVYVFGTNRDQSAVGPNVILASAVSDIPGVLRLVASAVRDGKFSPREKPYGLKDKGVYVAFNPRLQDKIPSSVLDRVRQAEKQILSGELSI